jgi:hypothetical protein
MYSTRLNFERLSGEIDPEIYARNADSRRRSMVYKLGVARKAYKNAITAEQKELARLEVLRLSLEWRFLNQAIREGRPINPAPPRSRRRTT